jgi:hypothetical protein
MSARDKMKRDCSKESLLTIFGIIYGRMAPAEVLALLDGLEGRYLTTSSADQKMRMRFADAREELAGLRMKGERNG